MKQIGIFAGAFDPIHDGHLDVAKTAVKYLGLDTVYFMIESRPWGDKNPIALNHRKNMVELAIDADEKLKVLDAIDEHFDNFKTLPVLESQFVGQELYFILGGDVFMKMNNKTWPGLEKLLKHYLVVYERKDIREQAITEHAIELGIAIAILPSAHLHLASTDVRLEPHNKAIWLPKKVSEYIDSNNLYQV